jgi:F-type H+-transporting ATPase subunit a
MEEHVTALTQLVNHLFGVWALRLLHALHIQPADYETPIPEYVVMSLVVLILLVVLAIILRSQLSVERPGTMQQAAEGLLTNSLGFGIKDVLDASVSHGAEHGAEHAAERFIPFIGTVSIFVLFANLLGVIPALHSPTSFAEVPLACALLIFLYFNWQGIRHHGPLGYAKHLTGPIWWLAWLNFPVEVLSISARLLSLTVRLWANIFASDLIYVLFFGLLLQPFVWATEKSALLALPFGVLVAVIPLVFILLHIFVSFIQAYIFAVLPAIYVGDAVSEGHTAD